MHYYSPSKNAFYPDALKQDYIDAGTFPDDVTEVDDDVWLEYAGNLPPDGKVRTAGEDGRPTWISAPALTQAQRMTQVNEEKQRLLNQVKHITQLWQTQLSLGMLSDDNKSRLIAWMTYAQQVESVAPEDPDWPEKPV
ncbi:phage tail protein [Morganella morganii]|uniref:Phage tail protein n=1 Tax=Morganella morganii TaxID=582 RepID=A0A8I0Q051_MORMO|nr:tail fiber assembly protein [Morganella morganii]MBE8611541.1 phage tail protein [Morganella morganii]